MAKKNEVSAVENTQVALVDISKLKKIADVVIPSLSIKGMKEGDTLYIRAESEIRYSEQVDEKTGEVKMNKAGTEKELLPIIIAVNVQTGQRGQMVLPAIVYRGMKAMGDLNGRMFALMKGESLGTGKANLWEVVEVAIGE